MVQTGYFKTDKISGKIPGWSGVATSINQPVAFNRRTSLVLGTHVEKFASNTDTDIYMHEELNEFGQPILDENIWDGSDTEFSGPGKVYECYSDANIFDTDQNFGDHNILWTVSYQAKVANTPGGQTPFINFLFYKVDGDSNETFLFEIKGGVGLFYTFSPQTTTGMPTGSVLTTDRLKIEVSLGSEVPA